MKTKHAKVGAGEPYTAPHIEIIEVSVEQGYAISNDFSRNWGELGKPGQDLGELGEYEL